MSTEFTLPSWLNSQDAETIQQRMMDSLPPDIDHTEGGFPWDFTMPTALEKAELLEFFLPETLKIMFPQYAYGEWLDLHGEGAGLTRRAAECASGYLTVRGVSGTVIPEGFLFAVPAVDGSPAVIFSAQETVTIDSSGSVSVPVTALEAGTVGNVPSGSIVLMVSTLAGVTEVTNPARLTGGSETEDDDTFRERILDAMRSGYSFVGCNSDYIRWAKEVNGVGNVLIDTQFDTEHPNLIRLIVFDSSGFPANENILNNVRRHIMGDENYPETRLAPIGAELIASAPEGVGIAYEINGLELEDTADESSVLNVFAVRLQDYYPAAKEESVVRHTRVCAILSGVGGVIDFENITMNGAADNIHLETMQYPVSEKISVGETEIILQSVTEDEG